MLEKIKVYKMFPQVLYSFSLNANNNQMYYTYR